jgi:hypothetical protein
MASGHLVIVMDQRISMDSQMGCWDPDGKQAFFPPEAARPGATADYFATKSVTMSVAVKEERIAETHIQSAD